MQLKAFKTLASKYGCDVIQSTDGESQHVVLKTEPDACLWNVTNERLERYDLASATREFGYLAELVEGNIDGPAEEAQ